MFNFQDKDNFIFLKTQVFQNQFSTSVPFSLLRLYRMSNWKYGLTATSVPIGNAAVMVQFSQVRNMLSGFSSSIQSNKITAKQGSVVFLGGGEGLLTSLIFRHPAYAQRGSEMENIFLFKKWCSSLASAYCWLKEWWLITFIQELPIFYWLYLYSNYLISWNSATEWTNACLAAARWLNPVLSDHWAIYTIMMQHVWYDLLIELNVHPVFQIWPNKAYNNNKTNTKTNTVRTIKRAKQTNRYVSLGRSHQCSS